MSKNKKLKLKRQIKLALTSVPSDTHMNQSAIHNLEIENCVKSSGVDAKVENSQECYSGKTSSLKKWTKPCEIPVQNEVNPEKQLLNTPPQENLTKVEDNQNKSVDRNEQEMDTTITLSHGFYHASAEINEGEDKIKLNAEFRTKSEMDLTKDIVCHSSPHKSDTSVIDQQVDEPHNTLVKCSNIDTTSMQTKESPREKNKCKQLENKSDSFNINVSEQKSPVSKTISDSLNSDRVGNNNANQQSSSNKVSTRTNNQDIEGINPGLRHSKTISISSRSSPSYTEPKIRGSDMDAKGLTDRAVDSHAHSNDPKDQCNVLNSQEAFSYEKDEINRRNMLGSQEVNQHENSENQVLDCNRKDKNVTHTTSGPHGKDPKDQRGNLESQSSVVHRKYDLGHQMSGSHEKGQRLPEDMYSALCKPCTEWSSTEVVYWLRSQGFKDSVWTRFEEQGVTGEVLRVLTEKDLKEELCLKLFGERRSVFLAITRLATINHPTQHQSNNNTTTTSSNNNSSNNSSPQHSPVTHHHYYQYHPSLPPQQQQPPPPQYYATNTTAGVLPHHHQHHHQHHHNDATASIHHQHNSTNNSSSNNSNTLTSASTHHHYPNHNQHSHHQHNLNKNSSSSTTNNTSTTATTTSHSHHQHSNTNTNPTTTTAAGGGSSSSTTNFGVDSGVGGGGANGETTEASSCDVGGVGGGGRGCVFTGPCCGGTCCPHLQHSPYFHQHPLAAPTHATHPHGCTAPHLLSHTLLRHQRTGRRSRPRHYSSDSDDEAEDDVADGMSDDNDEIVSSRSSLMGETGTARRGFGSTRLGSVAGGASQKSWFGGRTAPRLQPEYLKTTISCLYMILVTWITAIVMVFVHDRVPDRARHPPLPDIFLDNVPHIPWAFQLCEVTIIILTCTLVIILLFHKHRCIIIRRFSALSGTVFLLRCATMFITSLSVPGTHLQCSPRERGSVWLQLEQAWIIWQGGGLSIKGVRTCGDYMFSGHTTALTMLNFFITEYTPRRMYYVHISSWVLNMFGVFFVLAAHEHYSIDVFIAFYITSRMFLYYHSLANNRALHQRDSFRTKIWFPMFSFFESSIDGIVPNEYSNLFAVSNLRWTIAVALVPVGFFLVKAKVTLIALSGIAGWRILVQPVSENINSTAAPTATSSVSTNTSASCSSGTASTSVGRGGNSGVTTTTSSPTTMSAGGGEKSPFLISRSVDSKTASASTSTPETVLFTQLLIKTETDPTNKNTSAPETNVTKRKGLGVSISKSACNIKFVNGNTSNKREKARHKNTAAAVAASADVRNSKKKVN